MKKKKNGSKLWASFYEIYNEKIYDLLSSKSSI